MDKISIIIIKIISTSSNFSNKKIKNLLLEYDFVGVCLDILRTGAHSLSSG